MLFCRSGVRGSIDEGSLKLGAELSRVRILRMGSSELSDAASRELDELFSKRVWNLGWWALFLFTFFFFFFRVSLFFGKMLKEPCLSKTPREWLIKGFEPII